MNKFKAEVDEILNDGAALFIALWVLTPVVTLIGLFIFMLVNYLLTGTAL